MIGHHFTSAACWDSIRADGEMRAYRLHKPEIEACLRSPLGIFVFPDEPGPPLAELGCVLFQVLAKQTFQVVHLAVEYGEADLAPTVDPGPAATYRFTHDGSLGAVSQGRHTDWPYHSVPMLVLAGPVPAGRVSLLRAYDLEGLLAGTLVP